MAKPAMKISKRALRECVALFGMKPRYTVGVFAPRSSRNPSRMLHSIEVSDYKIGNAIVRALRDHYAKEGKIT